MEGDKKKPEVEAPGGPATPAAPAAGTKQMAGKYVPPSMRDGAGKGRGEVMQSKRGIVLKHSSFFHRLHMTEMLNIACNDCMDYFFLNIYQKRKSMIFIWDRNSFLAYPTGISVNPNRARKCCLS